ncbi:hypothetical protein BP6252_12685 [Coleophoma cylindrospora]|uniref:Uncharacterized protein n=1 Tax=Coleophoma cylindrospora TaxID=1849047 RepID=A0A3D8QDB2_9HELO|nr:hypothetical protein BP6252_12685 [Coleophoma cylindrospora]
MPKETTVHDLRKRLSRKDDPTHRWYAHSMGTIYPSAPAGSVTLTTSKAQETRSYIWWNFRPRDLVDAEQSGSSDPMRDEAAARLFMRTESRLAFEQLPHLRPMVLYLHAEQSNINIPRICQVKLKVTGRGLGESGGVESRMVEEVVLKGSHFIPFEKPRECTGILGNWLEKVLVRDGEDRRILDEKPSGKSERDGLVLSKLWLE